MGSGFCSKFSRKIMNRCTGNLVGPDDSTQKKITYWFKRKPNPVAEEDRSLSEAARKRRKTSSLLKPQNSQEPVPVVDLFDPDYSDDDDHFFRTYSVTVVEISTAGPSGKADEDQRLTGSKIPVYITEFDKVGVKTEGDNNSKTNAGEGETQLIQTTSSSAVHVGDEDERAENSVSESSLEKTQGMVADESDADNEKDEEGKIFLRNLSSILESSQCSKEVESDGRDSVKIVIH